MSKKFVIITGGYECRWSPEFDSRADAMAWLDGKEWEERTEVEYEGDTATINCHECQLMRSCDLFEYEDGVGFWLCVECQPTAPVGIVVAGEVNSLVNDANNLFNRINDGTFTIEDAEDALEQFQALNRAVYYIGYSLKKMVDEQNGVEV